MFCQGLFPITFINHHATTLTYSLIENFITYIIDNILPAELCITIVPPAPLDIYYERSCILFIQFGSKCPPSETHIKVCIHKHHTCLSRTNESTPLESAGAHSTDQTATQIGGVQKRIIMFCPT